MSEHLVSPYETSSEVCHPQYCEKKLAKLLLTLENLTFFFKNYVFNYLLGVSERSCNFHSNCQITFWALKSRPLRIVTLDDARKFRPKTFLHRKGCLFFENLSFQQPLRS